MTKSVQDMDLEIEIEDIVIDNDTENYDVLAKTKSKHSARRQIDEYLAEKELAKLLGEFDDDIENICRK